MSKHELDPFEAGAIASDIGTMEDVEGAQSEDTIATELSAEQQQTLGRMMAHHEELEEGPETLKMSSSEMNVLLGTQNRARASRTAQDETEHTLHGRRTPWDESKVGSFQLKGYADVSDDEMHTMEFRTPVIDPEGANATRIDQVPLPGPHAQPVARPIFQHQPSVSGTPREDFVGDAFLSPGGTGDFEVESMEVIAEDQPLPTIEANEPLSVEMATDVRQEEGRNPVFMVLVGIVVVLLLAALYVIFD